MLDKFPGLLGYGGIIAIHADWPIYPTGIGWEIALRSLGNFPEGTQFYEIDDIDRCKLLIIEEPVDNVDYYNYKYYHVAIWHSDLLNLKKHGLIEGIVEMSDEEFELERFKKFKKHLGKNLREDSDGNIILHMKTDNDELQEIVYHKPFIKQDDENQDISYKDCAGIAGYLKLTNKGSDELSKLSEEINYTKNLKDLVKPLIAIGRYDAAVRDASLLLETSIKTFHKKGDFFGQNLIDYHINDIISRNDNFNSAAIKCYRGELRTIFKFIRNDFAHNFKIISEAQCKVILKRINETLIEFDEVVNAYYK